MSRWLRPQVVVAALLVAVAVALAVRERAPLPQPDVQLEAPDPTVERSRATLVLVRPDDDGSVGEPVREETMVEVRDGRTARSEAILAALRERMAEDGLWPQDLAAPRVFLVDRARGTAWAIALPAGAPPRSVAAERSLARSLEATARANGASEVAFVPAEPGGETLFGRVWVPTELDSRR